MLLSRMGSISVKRDVASSMTFSKLQSLDGEDRLGLFIIIKILIISTSSCLFFLQLQQLFKK
ncbi:hypothetical protein E2C01_098928 [Portunus trituberculatus]|uniref:Uncharacterized protein n=1 Tax=Portunus trituberculatus TaxID=210409 RepID=A0A5B7KDI7_PORTR|nr:hypothetical protein [Portunus trituberculatus]